MILFDHAPLRRKLTTLTMVCSVVALVSTGVALGVYEWYHFRKSAYLQLETLSMIAARNSAAALAFLNAEDAGRVLTSLDTEPAITAASLYDARGGKVAEYHRAGRGAVMPLTAPADGTTRIGGELQITVPVIDGKRFGTLAIRADLSGIKDRIVGYVLVLVGTTTVSGLLAFLLSGWLSRRIVDPVRNLVAAASAVKTKADYSIRVEKQDDDELGALTSAFNEMLERIQRNEEELYRGTERLRLAIESARVGTWDWNLVRDEVVWNERNYEIFGLEKGAPVSSQVFFSLVHSDDRDRVRTAIETAARTATDFAVEFRLSRPDRLAHYVAARGLFLKSSAGDPLRAVGVTLDITERRGAELRVMESEMRFRAVAERAPALIWSCDQGLQRDYCNKTWLSFTGRTLEQELGLGWQHGMPEADLEHWRKVVGAAAAQSDPYSIEYRLRRADGALRWMVETGSPRTAADGSFAGYLGSCIDITARKENEAELETHVRLRTAELQAVNQELESFSYSVSHDLRGPVRAIQGFAEIAVEELQANRPDVAIERLQRVIRAADRMNKLIDAFISMARISRVEVRLETVNLSRIAEEVMGFLRVSHPDRNVEASIEPGLLCRGDDRLLRIALENLLSNAWKFTARSERARIELGQTVQDGAPVFYVRDNGAGFDPALGHKLFRAFERLHHAAQFEGMGVGLSTVQRVIAKHGGRIWAEGRVGEGATFYFTLPPPSEAGTRLVAEAAASTA